MKPSQRVRRPTPEFLLVDAGNTRLKWTVAGRNWPKQVAGEIATEQATPGWVASLAKRYPGHRTVLASVVPRLVPAFRRYFAGRLQVTGAGMPQACFGHSGTEFRFKYPKPSELGADRIAAAVAVQAWGNWPAIIVACGTATAYTVLDAEGRLCGGAIAPGLQAQLAALAGATAQLPTTTLEMPRRALAKSTREAIRAGVVLSFQGGVKETVARLAASLPAGPKPRIILTGGNAKLAAAVLGRRVMLRPLLVLEGLLIIATRLWMPAP